MNLTDTTQLGLEQAIAGAGLRQTAIAQNIANANTPGYQRKDVDFHSTLAAALESGREAVERAGFEMDADPASVMRVDGGGVDIDQESSALARNGLEYEALVAVARGRNDIMRSALGLA